MKNWLVNPTGKPNSWVPVDLLQEHMNFWIKVNLSHEFSSTTHIFQTFYKAHGSNASWEWLEMIGPCVDILRQLTMQINNDLGSRQGSRHSSPDLSRDIQELVKSLREHRVYVPEPGRVIESDKSTVPNVISVGLHTLPTPLREYNEAFSKLRERRRMVPLIGTPTSHRPKPSSPSIPAVPPPSDMNSHSPLRSIHSTQTQGALPSISDPENEFSSDSEVEEDENDGLCEDDEDELLPREFEEDVELYLD